MLLKRLAWKFTPMTRTSLQRLRKHRTRLHKTVDALFSNCTHVSIHCNLTDETHHLVNAERRGLHAHIGKDGARCGSHIINCARGGIVDEQAVLEALESGGSLQPPLMCSNRSRWTRTTRFFKWNTFTARLTLGRQPLKPKGALAWTSRPMSWTCLRGEPVTLS